MDPTQTLAEIRELMADSSADSEQLAERVEALDEWITKGGFLPEQWARRGRPRLQEDGPVLEGVNHGSARGYNLGCRCIPCREANRIKGAIWRQKQREEQA